MALEKSQKITASRLRELLNYDPETGIFTRLTNCRQSKVGDVVGCNSRGYVGINVDGCMYTAHRLAWLFIYGELPNGGIDHINCNKSDNRVANLRLATTSQNAFNRGKNKNNTVGFKGVTFNKRAGRYVSVIQVSGHNKWLGSFESADKAHAAYCAAAAKYHGEFARTAIGG